MAQEWLTTSQAAEISGLHPEYIRELLREGKITGRRFGAVWQVERRSLERFVKARIGERRGRPKIAY